MSELSTGATAPDFQLSTADGDSYRLADALKTGDVLLAFCKASCPTCQLTFPCLQKLHDALAGVGGVSLFGISQDEVRETQDFRAEYGLRFPILLDEHPYRVSSNFGVTFVPTLCWVQSTAVVEWSDFGFRKSTLTRIANAIGRLTGRDPVGLFTESDGLPEFRPG